MALAPESRGPRDIYRCIVLMCSYASMIKMYLKGHLYKGEIHGLSDFFRLFLQGALVAPVWHEEVGSEAEMLAIHVTNANGRGCFRGDKVYRTDTETVWELICDPDPDPLVGHGELLEQWIEYKRTPVESDPTVGDYIPLSSGDPDNPAYLFTSEGVGILIFIPRT